MKTLHLTKITAISTLCLFEQAKKTSLNSSLPFINQTLKRHGSLLIYQLKDQSKTKIQLPA